LTAVAPSAVTKLIFKLDASAESGVDNPLSAPNSPFDTCRIPDPPSVYGARGVRRETCSDGEVTKLRRSNYATLRRDAARRRHESTAFGDSKSTLEGGDGGLDD